MESKRLNKEAEAKAKRTWDADASLQAEFLGDFETYVNYLQATESGLAKVQGGRRRA